MSPAITWLIAIRLPTGKSANDIVRAHHALTVSPVNCRNSALPDALRSAPNFAVGGWAWVYYSASTICRGAKTNTDAKVLDPKLALNWTGPYKILAVGSCSAAETRSGVTSSIWISLPTCPVQALVGVCHRAPETLRQPPRQRGHAQIPTGGADTVRAQHFFQDASPVPRHSRRRFDSPSTAGGGADYRSSVGAGARWRHRGAIQDALGGTLRTFLRAANTPPPLPLPHLASLGRNPAKPTASTDECGSGRHSASSPSTTGNVS